MSCSRALRELVCFQPGSRSGTDSPSRGTRAARPRARPCCARCGRGSRGSISWCSVPAGPSHLLCRSSTSTRIRNHKVPPPSTAPQHRGEHQLGAVVGGARRTRVVGSRNRLSLLMHRSITFRPRYSASGRVRGRPGPSRGTRIPSRTGSRCGSSPACPGEHRAHRQTAPVGGQMDFAAEPTSRATEPFALDHQGLDRGSTAPFLQAPAACW